MYYYNYDYEKQRRYRNVISRLRVVNSRVQNLNNALTNLESLLGRSISINDQAYKGEQVATLKRTCSDVSATISNSIIPSLESNI
jgi:hypothetical protein